MDHHWATDGQARKAFERLLQHLHQHDTRALAEWNHDLDIFLDGECQEFILTLRCFLAVPVMEALQAVLHNQVIMGIIRRLGTHDDTLSFEWNLAVHGPPQMLHLADVTNALGLQPRKLVGMKNDSTGKTLLDELICKGRTGVLLWMLNTDPDIKAMMDVDNPQHGGSWGEPEGAHQCQGLLVLAMKNYAASGGCPQVMQVLKMLLEQGFRLIPHPAKPRITLPVTPPKSPSPPPVAKRPKALPTARTLSASVPPVITPSVTLISTRKPDPEKITVSSKRTLSGNPPTQPEIPYSSPGEDEQPSDVENLACLWLSWAVKMGLPLVLFKQLLQEACPPTLDLHKNLMRVLHREPQYHCPLHTATQAAAPHYLEALMAHHSATTVDPGLWQQLFGRQVGLRHKAKQIVETLGLLQAAGRKSPGSLGSRQLHETPPWLSHLNPHSPEYSITSPYPALPLDQEFEMARMNKRLKSHQGQ